MSVPLEKVRQLLIGQLDPVKLAKEILSEEDVELVIKHNHMDRDNEKRCHCTFFIQGRTLYLRKTYFMRGCVMLDLLQNVRLARSL